MKTVSVKIDCSVDKVWGYFTTPSNWIEWYGGVKEVVPRWKTGAKIVWASGASSPLAKVIPGKEICMSGAWMDVTYRFKSDGNVGTVVEVVESDPKGGASFTDGGEANEAKWERNLQKLKECIENDSRFYSPIQPVKKVVKERTDIEETKHVLGEKNILVQMAKCDLCSNKIPTGEGYCVHSETEMGVAISGMPNNNVVIGTMLYCENCANSLFTDEIWAEAKNIVFESDGKLDHANLRQAYRQAITYSIAMRAKRRGLSATQARQEAQEIGRLWWKDKQAAEWQLLAQAIMPKVSVPIPAQIPGYQPSTLSKSKSGLEGDGLSAGAKVAGILFLLLGILAVGFSLLILSTLLFSDTPTWRWLMPGISGLCMISSGIVWFLKKKWASLIGGIGCCLFSIFGFTSVLTGASTGLCGTVAIMFLIIGIFLIIRYFIGRKRQNVT